MMVKKLKHIERMTWRLLIYFDKFVGYIYPTVTKKMFIDDLVQSILFLSRVNYVGLR